MKTIKVLVGVRHKRKKLTWTGSEWEHVYEVSDGGDAREKCIKVSVPDWVNYESLFRITRPGYQSKCGNGDRCFVTYAHPIRKTIKVSVDEAPYSTGNLSYDEIDAMLDDAIAGGMLLWYPTESGDMESMPVQVIK